MRKLLLVLLIIFTFDRVGYSPEYRTLPIVRPNPIFHMTMEDVDVWLKECSIKFPSIVKAQIRLETGHFTSLICRENKNLFGMRYPSQRSTTAIGELNGHALYTSYKSSIEDYKIWQDIYYCKGENYYTFLLRIKYATDSSYINKLKYIKI